MNFTLFFCDKSASIEAEHEYYSTNHSDSANLLDSTVERDVVYIGIEGIYMELLPENIFINASGCSKYK